MTRCSNFLHLNEDSGVEDRVLVSRTCLGGAGGTGLKCTALLHLQEHTWNPNSSRSEAHRASRTHLKTRPTAGIRHTAGMSCGDSPLFPEES